MRSDRPAWGRIQPDPRSRYAHCPLCGKPMPVPDRDATVLPVHRTRNYRMCFREPITIAQARELRRFRLRAHP